MHIEVHAPVQALFDIDPGHRNPVLELVPRLLCVNVLLGGLDDLAIGIELGPLKAGDNDVGGVPGQFNECLSHGLRQFCCVPI